jgi:16S rRNA (guanine527-N7)-methyltransferase
MLSEESARRLLFPFGLNLNSSQLAQLLTYLDLLLRWNRKINLTAIRDPEACVSRHFGESLYLARWVELGGRLLDVGSGAGFPGLALKIAFPSLSVTLLEPVAKKRAFLKEAARACEMALVEVRRERLNDFLRLQPQLDFDAATARAVGHLDELFPLACQCLKPGGSIFLWMSQQQGEELSGRKHGVDWGSPIPIPLSHQREIRCGTRKS